MKVADSVALAAMAEAARLKASEAEKDSLIQDVLETTRFVNEINTELGKVRSLKSGRGVMVKKEDGTTVTAAAYRASILERIQELTQRLEESETRLAASRTRVESAVTQDPRLLEQIAEYRRTLAEYRDLVDDQRKEIATLNARVTSLAGEVTVLAQEKTKLSEEKTALADSMLSLAENENTVFWIAGSKDELKAIRVIVEEGGGGIFRRSGTLQPNRTLDESLFTAVNKLQTASIPLPKPNYWYKVVSRQSLQHATGVTKDRIRGSLAISNPAAFWATSRHLILVEDGK